MRKRIPLSEREDYDVLAEFDGPQDLVDDSDFFADTPRMVRSAGATLALMVLTALAFAGGISWGASRGVSMAPGNAIWDIILHVGFIIACGLFAAAVALAAGMLVVGIPYARNKMAQSRAANARSQP